MVDYEKIFKDLEYQLSPTNPVDTGREVVDPSTIMPGKGFILNKPNLPVLVEGSGVDITLDFNVEIVKSSLGVEKVEDIVKKADGFLVETDEEVRRGVALALKARKQGKAISKLRKSLSAPALAFQKKAIAVEKEFTDQLSTVESDLFEKIEIYQTQRKATLDANNIIDESFETLKTELGSCSIKSYHEYKVKDVEAVPREYFKLDIVKIQADLKAGVRHIPGLEIYEIKKKQYRLKGEKK